MIDFLRNNPYVTKEEYLWRWTVPQVMLASMDFSHEIYVKKKEKKERIDSVEDLIKDFGMINNKD